MNLLWMFVVLIMLASSGISASILANSHILIAGLIGIVIAVFAARVVDITIPVFAAHIVTWIIVMIVTLNIQDPWAMAAAPVASAIYFFGEWIFD